MSREIKFRVIAKNKVVGYERIFNGQWEWMCLELNPDNGIRWVNGTFKGENLIRDEFTSLHDKNGKEIYEGDILNGWRKGSNSDREYTGIIEWQQQQAGWVIKCGKYIMEILSLAMSGDGIITQLDSFEVIGNIYENPELLNQK